MPKNKWKVQYRGRRGAKWKTLPASYSTRLVARGVGVTLRHGSVDCGQPIIYGPFGFGNTRVVRVK